MLKKKRNLISAGILTTALLATATPSMAFATPNNAGTEKTDRYIVSYHENADASETGKNIGKKGGKVDKSFKHALKGATVTATYQQAQEIKTVPGVKAIELDQKVQLQDTQQTAPWGLDRSDQQNLPLNGTYNYDTTAGKGVNVYVVDSGVLASHADFTGRIQSGWTTVEDGLGSSDCNGHGTHVAGTAAGKTYGIAKSATIIPVRVFGCTGSGYMSEVIEGLDWITAHHTPGTPAVANLSLGGGASLATDTAVQNVIADGVTVTVAAGNSATDACNSSPARVKDAITVAASDNTDTQASFSSFGSCVDLYAPGVSILSAWHTSPTATAYASGTSMAAPHVAGTAAILLSRNAALTPADISATITTASTAGIIRNATVTTPNRLLNIPAVSATPVTAPAPAPAPVATAPAAPTGVTATAKVNGAGLSWTKGADNGSALTKQTIHVYEGTTKIQSLDLGPEYTSATLNGFPSGKTYTFTVSSTNSAGNSPESVKSNAVTTLANAPAAPTAVKATAGTGSAVVSWVKGSDGGSALTSQVVTVYNGATVVKTVTVPASATSSTIAGLYNGTYYTFTVKAVNSAGTSPESAKSAQMTPIAKVANPATSVKAVANDNAATISWVKGNDNGAPLTSQVVTIYSGLTKVGTATISGSYTSIKVTGLTQGKYYSFTIKEVNKMGTSAESAKSNLVRPF